MKPIEKPTTMFELQQRMRAHKPTDEEREEFKRNREQMEQWEFYHWYNGLGDKRYEVGDIVSRDGTDEHVIEDIDYDFGLLTVRCTKEPFFTEGNEPWAKIGEQEGNLIRRYSLISKKL